MMDKKQFIGNLNSKLFYSTFLATSLSFWKPVIEAHPTRIMWGTDLAYWRHYEPDVIHAITQFGRDFISNLEPEVQESFAHRNASEMLDPSTQPTP